MKWQWSNVNGISPSGYRCGFCDERVAADRGYFAEELLGKGNRRYIQICPNCDSPTYVTEYGLHIPSPKPGNSVDHVPKEVYDLYNEARSCVGIGAYTASVLASRKLLMNIAVSQGAPAGQSFIAYVQHLADSGFVPPNGKGWVDHIRKKGNEATHEILPMSEADAKELVSFSEMLLKFIFEFPNRVPSDPVPSS
ncbi:DUF4145 domain-containing protein [Mesorhizobium sp. 8]|uniref:DUF4145 domain-containing protein n=1 Tax=Mesorhizobium sp. 8 TaxID=2584466 RepID=UPI001122A2B6|nr:DUF4145 domain-containing protein [Mesorhizobium sp. 8]QDB99523.1 DUF4145 domain-containing protein [Mesorhizobium sp. 8]